MSEETKQRAKQLHAAEIALDAKLEALQRQRGAVDATTGEAVLTAFLEGGDGQDVVNRLRDVDAEIKALQKAIDAGRQQRKAAIRAGFAEQAGALRHRASGLKGEIAEREKKLSELLAAVTAFEGVEFVPAQPPRGPSSVPSQGIGRTEQLRQQVRALEAQAARWAGQDAPCSGSLRADTVQGLLAALAEHDPMVMGPTLESTRTWAAEAAKQPPRKSQNLIAAPGLRGWKPFFRLSWSAGEISQNSGLYEEPIFAAGQEQVA